MAGSSLQMETQPEFERENNMGRPVFQETDPNSLFSMVYFYILRWYAKVTWGQQSWLLSVRCFIQMYSEVLGVLHHLLARGPSDNLWPSPCDSSQSTRTLPRSSPGQNTGVGSLSLLQGIFSIQGLNLGLPRCRWILYQLNLKGSQNLWDQWAISLPCHWEEGKA